MSPHDQLEKHFRLLDVQKKALKRLGILTVRDLYYHFPTRYEHSGDHKTIAGLVAGAEVVLFGTIRKPVTRKTWKSRRAIAEATLEDGTGKIKIMWFNQPYIAKLLADGALVKVSGRVEGKDGKLYLANPEVERTNELPMGGAETIFGAAANADEEQSEALYAIYPETQGITSRWFRHALAKLIRTGAHQTLEDPIPADILERYHLPALATALVWVHAPKHKKDAQSARKRFAFEEVFTIQVAKLLARRAHDCSAALPIPTRAEDIDAFVSRFPFSLTTGQNAAIAAILKDISAPPAMSRLLEGDVGSGKTAIAATTAYAVVMTPPPARAFGNLQVAYMAPTEILAEQHFQSFIEYFKHLPIQIGLITSSGCKKFPSKVNPSGATAILRTQLLKWVANGEIPILIGTHALIQKSVRFKNLAYVIVDEQHRFGTSQRAALARGHNAETMRNLRGDDAELTRKSVGTTSDSLLYRDLTYRIRAALFAVKDTLGGGHKEVVYQRAVAEELTKAGLAFSREVHIPIMYNKKQVGVYVPDFVIEQNIILELKALTFVGATEKKQLWSYVRGSEYRLALLANFGPRELTINRIIYDTARASASVSASDPHSSAFVPHLLSMTATPIPRTLALTIYGDLDLTVLNEMPAGRKRVQSEIVTKERRQEMYAHLCRELEAGRQAYVICPRIDEPDPRKENAVQAKSARAEAARLGMRELKGYRIGLLHGQMKPKEKEETMRSFLAHELDVLVATSVVEVGVNVPNATVIVIEGAERFGLAQLHQLRGRVVRSTHQAYCFALTSSGGSNARLKAFISAKNGFELAELDLKLRGAGELYGRAQSGLTDLGMEALKNLKMVEAARAEAERITEEDETLAHFPVLMNAVQERKEKLHFE